ncbi:hypothetical protein L2449_21140 [Mesorhizobium muleiense]|nr:hypothetical protein [Mesorhizobium muleiense]MCF6119347.1 hypothetical protein [Mesorhizobium muleiense]
MTAWSFIHVILSVALLSTKRLALARAEISLASLPLGVERSFAWVNQFRS